jgi:hypothetical protein
MNIRTTALFVWFLAFGLIAKAEDSHPAASTVIPGGIVYSNGKDAIFLQLGTKEKFNLTSDLSKAGFKIPDSMQKCRSRFWREPLSRAGRNASCVIAGRSGRGRRLRILEGDRSEVEFPAEVQRGWVEWQLGESDPQVQRVA